MVTTMFCCRAWSVAVMPIRTRHQPIGIIATSQLSTLPRQDGVMAMPEHGGGRNILGGFGILHILTMTATLTIAIRPVLLCGGLHILLGPPPRPPVVNVAQYGMVFRDVFHIITRCPARLLAEYGTLTIKNAVTAVREKHQHEHHCKRDSVETGR